MARITGTKQIKRALRRAPKRLQDKALVEVRRSTKNMYDDARQGFERAADIAEFYHGKPGMQNVTGTLRRFYRWSVSKKQMKGRVGLLSDRANRKAFYLRFFNDGTENQPARPVHDLTFEEERERYALNQKRALESVLRELFP